jgi:hypothetical protein
MDFGAIEQGLSTLIETVSGIPVVCWENAIRQRHGGEIVLLSWVSINQRGRDESRIVDSGASAPTPNLTEELYGLRAASIQIAVETNDARGSGPNATAYCERIRSRLGLDSSGESLRALGLAVSTTGAVVRADYSFDGRMVSRSLFELRLNAIALETDAAIPSIDTVVATSEIESPTGSLVAAEYRWTDKVL